MPGEFSKKFHLMSSDFSSLSKKSPGKKIKNHIKKPAIYYKRYRRFPKIDLPRDFLSLDNLEDSLRKRHSSRQYNTSENVDLREISTMLYYTAGIHDLENPYSEENRRFYPTAGGFYSLELYLFIQRAEGVEAGLYHYCVEDHSLELLTKEDEDGVDIRNGINNTCQWGKEAPITIFITVLWDRVFAKYGDFGYRMLFLEAGHLSQNLALTSATLNIGCCNVLAFSNQKINKVLEIDEEKENCLYAAFLGK